MRRGLVRDHEERPSAERERKSIHSQAYRPKRNQPCWYKGKRRGIETRGIKNCYLTSSRSAIGERTKSSNDTESTWRGGNAGADAAPPPGGQNKKIMVHRIRTAEEGKYLAAKVRNGKRRSSSSVRRTKKGGDKPLNMLRTHTH